MSKKKVIERKDRGTTWEKVTLLTEGVFAYSSLVKINDTTLGVVSERENGDIVFQKVRLTNRGE